MFPLDTKTEERLAGLIVDIEGAYQRTGRQLERLLRDAGWSHVPEYDGSPRVGWLTERIRERRDDSAAVERLLCRVCDPLEYDGGAESAEAFRAAMNDLLAAERLTVRYASGRPVLGELGDDGSSAQFAVPPDLETRLRGLINDPQTADVLIRRAHETRICESAGAYTFAIIGIGSLVEGVLLAMLTERYPEYRDCGFIDGNGRKTKPERAGLALLIDTAHQKDWIQMDAADFMHKVRDYRNFVHPRKELAEQPDFDGDSVALCWAPVHAILNDLEQRAR